jgi:glycosyltransferase involved in cell wall biosynthesis
LSKIKGLIEQSNTPDRKCKIYVLHGNMTDEEMHALYVHEKINALVAIPHGEGFGLPIFEATYSGLPVVSIGWSGQCDFLYDHQIPPKPHFYEVGFDIRPVPPEAIWDDVIVKESGWAYAREESTKQQMRNCYNDITENKQDTVASNSCTRAKEVAEQFSEENMYKQFVEAVYDFDAAEKTKEEVEDLLNDLL